MSIYQDFKRGLALAPHVVLFADSRASFTYAEVDRLGTAIAAGLHALGPMAGTKIAVLSPNCADAFLALMGVIRAGAIFLPVNVRNAVQANVEFLRTCDCDIILYHSSLRDDIAEITAQCPSIKAALRIDDSDDGSDERALRQLVEGQDGPVPPEPGDDLGRVVLILATGGTTGASKAAPMTNRGWRAYADAGLFHLPPGDRCSYLVAGPMTHGAGMTGLIFLSRAATLVVLERPEPVAILAAIERHAITHMFAPPTMAHMLLECPALDTADLSSLAFVLIAASPIAPERLREVVARIGRSVCQSFGQSEAPLFLTFLSNAELAAPARGAVDRFASCGRATRGMSVEIMADNGTLLPPLERGEIVARGDLVFPGY